MAKTLQYRKTGAQTWIIATFDMVGTYTIQELDPVEYEIRVYDTEKDLYSEIITEIASRGYIDVTIPSSLVTTTVNTGVNITDNTIYPKSGGSDVPFSIEIWMKPQAFGSGLTVPLMMSDDGNISPVILYLTSTGTVRIDIQSSAGNRISRGTSGVSGTIELNKWHQIIITYNGSGLVSGLVVMINTVIPSTITTTSAGTYVGIQDLVGDFIIKLPITTETESTKFTGKLNMFRFFLNKVLTQAETIELYNEMKSRPLDGLSFESTCVLEHRFNNNIFSHIGEDATPIGALTYDTDLPWSVPINEINFYSYTSFESVMWAQMYRSSDWPEITTTKDYFVIYCTDHSTVGGGIAWAECDDVYFNGFVERGVIISEYQSETPWLIKIPTSKSGLATDTLFLYYHTVTGDPGNGGLQQTKLMTTTGGVLHTATWTQRGRPLGIFNDDNHTGYCRIFEKIDGTFIADHLTKGGANAKTYLSESTSGITYTRLLETTGLTVGGYNYRKNQLCPFVYNATQYAFIIITVDGGQKIAVVTLDDNFLPDTVIEILPEFYTMNSIMMYREGDTAFVNMKYSEPAYRDRKTYMVEYDLTQLDA